MNASSHAFRAAHDIVSHIWRDTVTHHIDSLLKWYGRLDTYGADLMIAGELARAGLMSDALDTLYDISLRRDLTSIQEADLQNVIDIYTILDTSDVLALAVHERSYIRSIAQSDVGASAGIARSILNYYGEMHPLPYYLNDLHDPPIRYRSNEDESIDSYSAIGRSNLMIHPVPASEQIVVEWVNSENAAVDTRLIVSDMHGKKVLNLEIHADLPLTVDIRDWYHGIYIAFLHNANGIHDFRMFVVE